MGALGSLTAAVAAVSWTALELRWRGFAATCGPYLQEPPAFSDVDVGPAACLATRLAQEYSRTAALPWSSCLTRSIALCRSLWRRDLPAVLRIGAALTTGALQAHAWVELDGRVVNDRATVSRDFTPFARNRHESGQ